MEDVANLLGTPNDGDDVMGKSILIWHSKNSEKSKALAILVTK